MTIPWDEACDLEPERVTFAFKVFVTLSTVPIIFFEAVERIEEWEEAEPASDFWVRGFLVGGGPLGGIIAYQKITILIILLNTPTIGSVVR